jgi:uncharacterized protein YqgV (UPF0045/DUF77 family)
MKKPVATIAFQVLPDAPTQKQTIAIIDEVIALIKKSGVRYEVGPMETTMEGDLDTLFTILRKSQDLCIKNGATSVFSNVKILYSPKGIMTIEEKVTKHRN